jgi:tight adherence protein B
MSPIILFGLLLLISFAVLVYLLKPTVTETAVRQHLKDIEAGPITGAGGTSILKNEGSDSAQWLEDVAKQLPGYSWLSLLTSQSGTKWQTGPVLAGCLCALTVTWWLASLMTSSAGLGGCIGFAVGGAPILYLWIVREVRFSRFDNLLPEAVDLMSRGLKAGHAISAVLEMVGNEVGDPVGSEFRTMAEEQSLGIPMREAMNNLVTRVPRDDVRFLSAAVLLQKETGGNLVQILDKTAVVMRERARLRGQLKIYTAQGRITGWILCSAPFAMFALINLVNKQYEKPLFTDPTGLKMIYAGLGMMVLGVLVIRKIIDIKV